MKFHYAFIVLLCLLVPVSAQINLRPDTGGRLITYRPKPQDPIIGAYAAGYLASARASGTVYGTPTCANPYPSALDAYAAHYAPRHDYSYEASPYYSYAAAENYSYVPQGPATYGLADLRKQPIIGGTLLGALAGGVIGNNVGGHHAWQGAAIGGAAGLILGSLAPTQPNRVRRATPTQQPVPMPPIINPVYYGTPLPPAPRAQPPAVSAAGSTTIIINNNYYAPVSPASAVNGLFGRP